MCDIEFYNKEAMVKTGANPQKNYWFRLFSATREHEGGIASNRELARRGENLL